MNDLAASGFPVVDEGSRALVSAAVVLVDERGPAALTIRELACAVGEPASRVYRRIGDKETLIALVGDEMLGEVPLPDARAGWREQAFAHGAYLRARCRLHPALARFLERSGGWTKNRLRYQEVGLEIFDGAGFAPDQALLSYYLIYFLTLGLAATSGEQTDRETIDEWHRNWRLALAASEPGQFPRLEASASALAALDLDQSYAVAVGVLLDGLEQQL